MMRAAFDRPVPKVILSIFGVTGAWDTFVAQYLPKEWAKTFPNIYQALEMTSGFLPLWGWALLGMALVSGVSIEFAYRRTKSRQEINELEVVSFGKVLKLTVKPLLSFSEARCALNFSWSSGEPSVFDSVNGHHVTIYSYDFDGDGFEEIVVRYHCGAHTHGMRVYKISPPPSGPELIPGADIGSDFPEISWKAREGGNGVIIFAKNRNWEGSLASDEPLVDRYIFENGRCVVAPNDRILEG